MQDRWFRGVNLATIRVLARNGWRVVVPRSQQCCGALAAHNGRLDTARALARGSAEAFADADVVVVNAAGCGAHLKDVGDLLDTPEAHALSAKVRDVMELLHDEGLSGPPTSAGASMRVAYHDACHALRAQGIRSQPREVLRAIPGLEIDEIDGGDVCCGAAGLYNVLEPEMSSELRRGRQRRSPPPARRPWRARTPAARCSSLRDCVSSGHRSTSCTRSSSSTAPTPPPIERRQPVTSARRRAPSAVPPGRRRRTRSWNASPRSTRRGSHRRPRPCARARRACPADPRSTRPPRPRRARPPP